MTDELLAHILGAASPSRREGCDIGNAADTAHFLQRRPMNTLKLFRQILDKTAGETNFQQLSG